MISIIRDVLNGLLALAGVIALVKGGEFLANFIQFRKNTGVVHLFLLLMVWVFVGFGMGWIIIWFIQQLWK